MHTDKFANIRINYNDVNLLALEITKLIFNQNPELINKNDDNLEISAKFLKQYAQILNCLQDIQENPDIISDKID